MLDLKTMNSALTQLEEERKIPKDKIITAIEQALAAAYKKDYGKRGQIIRARMNAETGDIEFYQVKIAVDDSTVRIIPEDQEDTPEEGDERPRYNTEHHILLEDARIIKSNAQLEDEIIFPLEAKDDFGRVAAQTAKQVIIQKIREAERASVIDEFGEHEGEVVSGIVQKFERGMVYVDLGRGIGVIPRDEQIPGERLNRSARIKAYLVSVDDSPRGVSLKLSRTHPKLIEGLFASEAPEVNSGVVEIKAIAREAGSRTKIAVYSNEENVDPVGSCVGQKGIRVATVMSELGNEKIDIIPWSEDSAEYVANSLSPAKVIDISVDEAEHKAYVEVADEHLSLAIGKGGQNVRLAARLTGWKIEIKGIHGAEVTSSDGDRVDTTEDAKEEEHFEEEIKNTEEIKQEEGFVAEESTPEVESSEKSSDNEEVKDEE
jgi:N utilization substance protein A